MGADYIGFRGCDLQRSLGVEGFLGKLKLRAYKGAIEAQVPEPQRATIKVEVQVTGRPPQSLDYPGICRELDTFLAGSPECHSCPLAGGKPVGCYRYVTYPVDAIAEELAFSFFCRELDTPDSIADQLYRDIVSRVPQGSGWHTQRPGPLAELPVPFVHTSRGARRVDSAQLLAGMFISLERAPVLVAYARFYNELRSFVAAEWERAAATDPRRAKELADSRTLRELVDVANLLTQIIPYAVSGTGHVFVDG